MRSGGARCWREQSGARDLLTAALLAHWSCSLLRAPGLAGASNMPTAQAVPWWELRRSPRLSSSVTVAMPNSYPLWPIALQRCLQTKHPPQCARGLRGAFQEQTPS